MAAAIAALRGAYGDSHSTVGRAYGRFSPIAWHFKRNLRWIERDEIQKFVRDAQYKAESFVVTESSYYWDKENKYDN